MIFFLLPRLLLLSNQLSRRLSCCNLRNIMENILKPPDEVYLMQNLDKNAFNKAIQVPVLSLRDVKLSSAVPLVKKYLLKLENFKPINHNNEADVSVYLNPEIVKTWSDLPFDIQDSLQALEVSEKHLKVEDFMLKYDNFTAEAVFRSVLPKDKEVVSSFTKVGHIVHVNLREHLLPYKNLIGQVLFDKVKGCESVVNKVNIIDNTYRNFKMEVLKGENNMLTSLKENNCKFEFDFSTVYWNSRLCTEHERIVKLLKPNHVLFDVFAGVGPFSIPAAKKKCVIFANDLNPESYKWLMHNKKLNKISDEYFNSFNLDGKEFILKVIKENLLKYAADHPVVIVMNLPAMAVEFLEAFVGLFKDFKEFPQEIHPITIYVYCFAKGEHPVDITRNLIHENLNVKDVDINGKIVDIFKVRTVSSMKEMMRVAISLDKEILIGVLDNKRKMACDSGVDAVLKKICCCRENGENGQKQEEKQQCVQSSRSQEFQDEGQSQSSKK